MRRPCAGRVRPDPERARTDADVRREGPVGGRRGTERDGERRRETRHPGREPGCLARGGFGSGQSDTASRVATDGGTTSPGRTSTCSPTIPGRVRRASRAPRHDRAHTHTGDGVNPSIKDQPAHRQREFDRYRMGHTIRQRLRIRNFVWHSRWGPRGVPRQRSGLSGREAQVTEPIASGMTDRHVLANPRAGERGTAGATRTGTVRRGVVRS